MHRQKSDLGYPERRLRVKLQLHSASIRAATIMVGLLLTLHCSCVPRSDLQNAFYKLAQGTEVLRACPQFQELDPRECTESDRPGMRLGCPTTYTALARPDDTEPLTCTDGVQDELWEKIDVQPRSRLAESFDTVEMLAWIRPVESATHIHNDMSEVEGECGPEFIRRKDRINFRFALYRLNNVSGSIADPDFPSRVRVTGGLVLEETNRLVCGWKWHSGTCGLGL